MTTTYTTVNDMVAELYSCAASYARGVDFPEALIEELADEVGRQAWVSGLTLDEAFDLLGERLDAEAATRGIGVADPS